MVADSRTHGLHNRRRTVPPGPDRARSSHSRPSTRAHTDWACHSIEQAGVRAVPRGPAHRDTPTCATDPDPGGQTHATGDTTSAGRVSALTGSVDTQCHRTLPVAHTHRTAGPSTYPHLGGFGGHRPAGGEEAGEGASGWAQARAGAGGLCSARAVRVRRPSALPHRVCGGRRLRCLICPRPRGGPAPANQGRRRPDERPAAPPPVLQLSSAPSLRQGRTLQEGDPGGLPAMKNLETLAMWGRLRGGALRGWSPGIPLLVGCAPRERAVLWEVDTRCGKAR